MKGFEGVQEIIADSGITYNHSPSFRHFQLHVIERHFRK